MLKEIDSKLTRIVIVSTFCTGITGIPLYLLFRESFTGGQRGNSAHRCSTHSYRSPASVQRFRVQGSGGHEPGRYDRSWSCPGILNTARVSRSGTTLTVLLMKGLKQDEALAISFIISVPAVFGAIVLDHSIAAIPWMTAAAMLIASLVVGYLTMDLLIRFAKMINFSGFCLALGLITFLLALGL